MSLEKLASKYIASTQHVLKKLEIIENPINVDEKTVNAIVECAKAYLEDAKYYKNHRKFEVSLTSVAYSEGLLDALKMLGVVSFEWLESRERRRES